MSFLSILAGIGRDLVKVVGSGAAIISTVATVAQPFVAILGPEASAIDTIILNATAGAEMLITNAQAGAAKKQTAIQIVQSELPTAQALIASFGSGFVIPQAELGALIDATVASKNALAAFVAAIKPKAKTP